MTKVLHTAAVAFAATALLTACTDDDPTVPAGEAPFAIVLAGDASSGAATSLATSGEAAGAALDPTDVAEGRIPLEDVASIVLPIGEVEAWREGDGADVEDEPGDGEWIVVGTIGDDVDLMALPVDGIEVLDSSLEQGEYGALRFWLTGQPTITLTRETTVGQATYEVGTHPLRIPSADNAGVRLHAAFVVDEDGELLTVLFDGQATVRGVTATGSGMLKIAPVLTVYDENGDPIGELDDGEIE